ncbi:MAG: ABC transporter permease subunit [Conexivisphaera sp.]
MYGGLVIAAAALATFARVLVMMGLSIATGWLLGYASLRSRGFESAYIPAVAVLESVPVIGFFPLVLVIFVDRIGGPLGVEMAADFLVFDAVVWNIWVGIYQAFKTVPRDLEEVTENYNFGFLRRMRHLYIPYSIPRIAANLFPSFADGLFYIMVSEVFSVGVHTYEVFGIGTLLTEYVASGQIAGTYYSLLAIAAGVVFLMSVFRYLARASVAKYGLDTAVPIRRRERPFPRRGAAAWRTLARPMRRLSRYASSAILSPMRRPIGRVPRRATRATRALGYALGAALLAYTIYSSYALVASVPRHVWARLLSGTPVLLYALAADYGRVALITLISFAISVLAGYYLATHARASSLAVPTIQTIAAFPPPAYFPLVYAATYRYMSALPGDLGSEIYVLMLGFLSTFYYVFFSFWMGVQSIPVEFWEIMENYRLGFWSRLRRVILPATLPYLVSGISSTVNSAWGGLMVGEYWPGVIPGATLSVKVGLMKLLDVYVAQGNLYEAAWASLIFGAVVAVYSLLFTERLMNLSRSRYIVEEGIYAA